MACDKCHGRFHEDGEELNDVDFGDAGAYTLCDHCAPRGYDYLRDWF